MPQHLTKRPGKCLKAWQDSKEEQWRSSEGGFKADFSPVKPYVILKYPENLGFRGPKLPRGSMLERYERVNASAQLKHLPLGTETRSTRPEAFAAPGGAVEADAAGGDADHLGEAPRGAGLGGGRSLGAL